ncbi:hypothetical protein ABFS83_03G079000 [Erythranthe nasuta]
MSRCFPYPPPGYTLSGDRKEALIESIKIQKDKVKSEEQRKKDRKREKKEKKKEKKQKLTHKDNEKNHEKSLNVAHGHIDKKSRAAAADVKGQSLLQKVSKAEADQLERSSLTEERGKPVLLPSTSADSTENSNKRKRQSSPLDCARAPGKIIRIKLSSKNQNPSPIDASVNEQQQTQMCSTSGRPSFPSCNKDEVVFRQRTEDLLSCTLKAQIPVIGRDPICSSSQQIEHVPLQKTPKTLVPSVTTPMQKSALVTGKDICSIPKPIDPVLKTPAPHLSRVQRNALRYKNLTEMWVPPQLDFALPEDTDEVDWLFKGKKNQGISLEKRCSTSVNDVKSCSSSSIMWPSRAQYLQEVDIYALPYTIPF